MEKLTEFPKLQERLAYLERAMYVALQQADADVFEGKVDLGNQHWQTNLRAEIRELRYVLAVLEQRDRIEIGRGTALLFGLVWSLVLVAQVALLVWAGN